MVPNKETLRIKYTHDKAETQPTPAVRWCAGRGFVFRVRHNWCVVLGKSFICDSVSPPVTVISQHCRVDYERYTKSALNASWRKRELELTIFARRGRLVLRGGRAWTAVLRAGDNPAPPAAPCSSRPSTRAPDSRRNSLHHTPGVT